MSPPIRDGSGSSIGAIRLGDGSEIAEVRTGAGDVLFSGSTIPDSVVHQYPVSTFTSSTWTNNVGNADMTVNGMSSSTFSNGEDSVSADGTDDHGLASGPDSLPENETFGVAFTLQFSSIPAGEKFWGTQRPDDNHRFLLETNDFFGDPVGNFGLALRDSNGNRIDVYTDNAFDDGNPHAVIINKSGNSGSDIDFYVDDMTTPVAADVENDSGFDNTSYSSNVDMAFHATNSGGDISDHMAYDAGIFEFNTEPYSQSERENFVSRRPEV